jgi:phosphatidylserine synthase
MGNRIYRNLPNFTSILGVIPLGFLLLPEGFELLVPMIIYNNFMDDLDGVLATRLKLKSEFGAILDNVCDAVSHTLFILLVCLHFGGLPTLAGVVAAIGVLVRISSRLKSPPPPPRGSATNELIRHLLFLLLLAKQFEFNEAIPLAIIFVLHGITMLVPFKMPHLVRSRAQSPAAIGAVNVALLIAWLVPITLIPIATCFVSTYLYSLVTQGFEWCRSQPATPLPPL